MDRRNLDPRRGNDAEKSKPGSAFSPPLREPPHETILPQLVPPTEREAQFYYRDLPSAPWLLGRTSAGMQPWPPALVSYPGNADPMWTRAPKKLLSPIGEHPIRDCWDETVQPLVVNALLDMPWSTIDIFRMGLDTAHVLDRPVVVWISLSTGTVPWVRIARCLRQIRHVLDLAGLPDVQCELRKSCVFALAGPPLMVPGSEPCATSVLTEVQPLTTALGQSCAGATHDTISGSLGLFLTGPRPDDGGEAPLFALACRHVALPFSRYPQNDFYRKATSNQLDKKIVVPSTSEVERIAKDVKNGLAFWVETALVRLAKDPNNVDQPPLETNLESFMTKRMTAGLHLEARQEILARLEPLAEWALQDTRTPAQTKQTMKELMDVTSIWKPFAAIESRIIGSVFLSHPLKRHRWAGSSARPHLWSRDWCLIQLDRSKFPENGNTLQNQVDLRGDLVPHNLNELLTPHVQHGRLFVYPDGGLLTLSGMLSLSDIQNPTALNNDGKECFLVGKRGPATGLTWGCPSELKSTVRYCVPGDEPFVTQEWAIEGTVQGENKAFSKPGDSGAVVFTADGRLAGILTSGVGIEDGRTCDLSYVTPIEPILDDVRETMGERVDFL